MQPTVDLAALIWGAALKEYVIVRPKGKARWAAHVELAQYIAREAKACLKERRLTELDPLVGDTACQTRAYEIAAIHRRYLKAGDLEPRDLRYVALSYLLTRTTKRDGTGKRRTDVKRVRDFSNLSGKEGLRLVEYAQRDLARLSVEMIEQLVVGLKGIPLAKAALTERCRRHDRRERPLLSCYYTCVAVFAAEKQAGRPIRVLVTGPPGEREWIYGPPESQAVVSVEFATTYESWEPVEKALETHGWEELTLTSAAQHAQYGSPRVQPQTIPHEGAQKEVERKAVKALKIGTHIDNPLILCRHVRNAYLEVEEK